MNTRNKIMNFITIGTLVANLALTSLPVTAAIDEPACSDPHNVTDVVAGLLARIHADYLDVVSFNVIPGYLDTEVAKLLKGQDDETGQSMSRTFTTRISGEHRCSKLRRLSKEQRKYVTATSTCPWYVVMETDPDRIPRSMAKAVCSCRRCLPQDLDGGSCSGRGKRGCERRGESKGRCKAIPYHVPVIRRTCVRGEYSYNIALEDVTAGCTCVRS